MSKLTILNVLNALLDRKRSRVRKEGVSEDWAEKKFEIYRASRSDDVEMVHCPKRRLSEISEDDFQDNIGKVRKFLKALKTEGYNCNSTMATKPTATLSCTLKVLAKDVYPNMQPEFSDYILNWLDRIYKFRRLRLRNINSEGAIISFLFNDNAEKVLNFLKNLQVRSLDCRFNIPQVRTRIEKLMGTNYVNLTDRDYMQKLQERILEDYEEQMEKRIRLREEAEMERVKNLVLIGKIPLDQAPPEMAKHPVMLIENYCNQLIAERRAKIKIYKVKIPTYLYWDDTPDPPSGLSIEGGHVFRKGEKVCRPVDHHLKSTEEEDVEAGYMMTQDNYDMIKYNSSLVKRLMECETVEEMYELAAEIIGELKTIDPSSKIMEDNLSDKVPPKDSQPSPATVQSLEPSIGDDDEAMMDEQED